VFCEGKRTEPEYLEGFRRAWRNPRVDVEVAKERGVPLTLVEKAKLRKEEVEKEARGRHDENLLYDEVWVVFDVDEHPNLPQALDLAEGSGIEAAVSNPCFELWLLLHFRDSPGMQDRHRMQKLLRNAANSSGKAVDFSLYQNSYEDAVTRARRLAEDAARMGEPRRNPTTAFYLLTESIRSS
jgi:hypothetical protein